MGLLVERERTSTWTVMYALYLYFLGLSFRSTAKAIEPFADRSHVAVWYWVQKFSSAHHIIYQRRRVSAFLIDETQVQIGHDEAWLWVAIEPLRRTVLGVYVSRHRNMLVAELFLRSLFHISLSRLLEIFQQQALFIQKKYGYQGSVFYWLNSNPNPYINSFESKMRISIENDERGGGGSVTLFCYLLPLSNVPVH